MSYTVQDLLGRRDPPLTVSPSETAKRAFELMWKNNYSQLPVTIDQDKPIGIVTHESILRALNHLQISLDQLRVSAAKVSAPTCRAGDSLFDVLEDLDADYASLVINESGKLVGILTQYDFSKFIRDRAEDMLFVENIELALRDHVRSAFSDGKGNLEIHDLCRTIDEIADPESIYLAKYKNALQQYLQKERNDKSIKPNNDLLLSSFKSFQINKQEKELHELTFTEIYQLLFHRSRWHKHKHVFGLEKDALITLLKEIAESRNQIMHFRGELDAKQREQLRFCADFMDNHSPPEPVPVEEQIRLPRGQEQEATREHLAHQGPPLQQGQAGYNSAKKPLEAPTEPTAPVPVNPISGVGGIPTSEKPSSSSHVLLPEEEESYSRYDHLAAHLEQLPPETERITLSFEQIEAILDGKLPSSARKNRSWWANDTVSHIQSQRWLEVGWRVASVNISEGKVSYARTEGRQDEYILFFSKLLHTLEEVDEFPLRAASPSGTNWIQLTQLPNERGFPVLCAFSRRRKFRLELYIDTGETAAQRRQEINKVIFDHLASNRNVIESQIGQSLAWERLDNRIASRVSLYRDGSILDPRDELDTMRQWVKKNFVPFCTALREPLQDVLEAAGLETDPFLASSYTPTGDTGSVSVNKVLSVRREP